jgi:hypothetical protein
VRTVRLHDTRTGTPIALEPRDGNRVGIYACGPTVYSRVHVGNARPYVVFLLLTRFLRHEGYDAVLVANVTDINDKIYDAARAVGRPSDELAREMTAYYVADTDRLGLGRPDHEPLATQNVEEIKDLIAELLERDHAYAVDGDVYFRVRSLPEYGELSHRDVDQMDQGEGVEGADRKEDPLDFALWKAQKPFEDTAWDAPWGRGRPGWHIECSAMAETLLGVDFEVHGGGIDLVFPHHENEAAQTLAARGRPLAKIWMHNGMVELGGGDGAEKMSKSLGNHVGVAEPPEESYGRTLSLPDEAMDGWFRLLAIDRPPAGTSARDAKRALARAVVERFHGADAARAAEEHFDRLHIRHETPDDVEDLAITPENAGVHLPALLSDGFGLTRSEARRLLSQGGVKLDGRALGPADLDVEPDRLDGAVLQVGKRQFRRLRVRS